MKDTVTKTADTLNETARDVWLAGLGAFSRAQEEGAKVFEALIKDGEVFEQKTRKNVNDKVGSLRGSIETRFDGVRSKSSSNFKKLENVFEDRVARVLARLGIPSADDIHKLTKRVEALSKEVKTLNAKGADKAADKAA